MVVGQMFLYEYGNELLYLIEVLGNKTHVVQHIHENLICIPLASRQLAVFI